jgi:hypothetical protein
MAIKKCQKKNKKSREVLSFSHLAFKNSLVAFN